MLAPAAANIKCDSLRHKPLTGPRYQIQRRRCQSATISPLVGRGGAAAGDGAAKNDMYGGAR